MLVSLIMAGVYTHIYLKRSANIRAMNEPANTYMMTKLTYSPHSNTEGRMKAVYEDGRVLKGKYAVAPISHEADGNVYRLKQVDGSLSGNYTRYLDASRGGLSGDAKKYRAMLVDGSGFAMRCDFHLSALGNSGVGRCQNSVGGDFRISF